MKIQISIILAITFLSFTSCKKESTIDFNNEVMISLTQGLGSSTTEPIIHTVDLPYFDITNYSNIESVVLSVSDIKTYNDEGDVVGVGTFELYDLTNEKTIESSIVESDDIDENTFKLSSNFKENIPQGKIKLGIKIYSGGDYHVQCSNIYLILSK